MPALAPFLLYLPLVIWAATGLGIVAAFRRSAPPVLLRFAAAFLALWALVASTAGFWVVEHGGGPGVRALLGDPSALFAPQTAFVWVVGGAVALGLLGAAFLLNQVVGYGLLRMLRPVPIDWPPGLAVPVPAPYLGRYRSEGHDAFSFTLIARAPGRRWRPARREVILLSEPLLLRLTPAERKAVVAHELGHLDALDTRYLTFVRTASRLLRWDPLFALIARSLTRREELRADRRAVERTGDPRALASALRKAAELSAAGRALPMARGLLGRSPTRTTAFLEERIATLGAMPAPEGSPEAT